MAEAEVVGLGVSNTHGGTESGDEDARVRWEGREGGAKNVGNLRRFEQFMHREHWKPGKKKKKKIIKRFTKVPH